MPVKSALQDELTLGDLVDAGTAELQTGPFGTMLHASSYIHNGVPVVAVKNISDNRIDSSDIPQISSDDAERLKQYALKEGDILFARKGAVERRALVRAEEQGWLQGSDCIRLRFNGGIDPRFFSYVLGTREMRRWLTQHAHGATMPSLNQSILRMLPMNLPPLPEQKKIALWLEQFDDKIDLNRRMSQTLEEIARALFKSWFVDFDPVHAKAAGRQPVGMDAETAALFPSEFEESELGLIPKGWSITPLDQIATFLNGLALQKFPVVGSESLPAIKIAQLKRRSPDGADRVGTHVPDAYVVQDGDMLFSWSGSLELVVWHGGTGALNQHLFKVTPNDLPDWLVYFWIDQHLPTFREIAADKATTMGHIQRRHLTEALTVLPSASVLCHAERMVSPMFRRASNAQTETRALAELRDFLLPRLVSGEIVPIHQGASTS